MQEWPSGITISEAREAVRHRQEHAGDFRLESQDAITWMDDRLDSIHTVHRLLLFDHDYADDADFVERDEYRTDAGLLHQNPRKFRPCEKKLYRELETLAGDIIRTRNAVWESFKRTTRQRLWSDLFRWNVVLTDRERFDIEYQLARIVYNAAQWKTLVHNGLYDNLISLNHEQTDGIERVRDQTHALFIELHRALAGIVTGHDLRMA